MLDICFLSSASEYGGAEKYLETLMAGCISTGLNCLMIVNSSNERLRTELDNCNAPHIAIDIHSFKLSTYIEIFNILKKHMPALLHINLPGPWACPLIAPLAKVAGIQSVVTTEHLPMFGPSIRHSPVKRLGGMFIDRTITVSRENVQYLNKIHRIKKEKIDVIHNGIDIEQFNAAINVNERTYIRQNYGFSETDFIFGIVGRITVQKGHEYALRAIAGLSKKHPDIKIAILGDGELMDYCKQVVRELNIESQVYFLGFQSDMQHAYKILDALLMPSTFEALPLTLLEAMAMGIPAVASSINGIPEVIENNVNGLLVPVGDVEAIEKSIMLLHGDKNILGRMKLAARKTIEDKFSLEKMVKDTIDVYKNMVASVPFNNT